MTRPGLGETAADIIALAERAGFGVTKRQLQRWHYEGLIPKPEQIWAEGVPGSEAAYPVGTGRQVVVLCLLRRKFRRSTALGWLLWWLGFPVDEKHWKASLHRVASWYDAAIPKLLSSSLQLFAVLRTLRIRNVIFRRLRKRLGADRFDNFMGLLLEILEGRFDGWSASASPKDPDLVTDKITMDRALGLFRARNTRTVEENAELYDDVERALVLLSARLGSTKLSEVLGDSSDQQLVLARNELRGILAIAVSATLVKTINDQWGFKVLAKFAEQATPKIDELFLLYLLALKEDSGFQANLYRTLNEFRAAVLSKTPVEQIESLRLRDPALAEFLHP
jgi:hypothetical protein